MSLSGDLKWSYSDLPAAFTILGPAPLLSGGDSFLAATLSRPAGRLVTEPPFVEPFFEPGGRPRRAGVFPKSDTSLICSSIRCFCSSSPSRAAVNKRMIPNCVYCTRHWCSYLDDTQPVVRPDYSPLLLCYVASVEESSVWLLLESSIKVTGHVVMRWISISA